MASLTSENFFFATCVDLQIYQCIQLLLLSRDPSHPPWRTLRNDYICQWHTHLMRRLPSPSKFFTSHWPSVVTYLQKMIEVLSVEHVYCKQIPIHAENVYFEAVLLTSARH